MKKRRFLQNKLWRDRAIDLMEQMGSVIHWERLDDEAYDLALRLKLLEEAEEVKMAETKEDLCLELADLLEVIRCIGVANGLSMDEIDAAREKKQIEKGSFIERKFVSVAEHIEGSFGTQYCLKAPDKYPEIV